MGSVGEPGCSLGTLTRRSEDLLEIDCEVCDPNKLERHTLVHSRPRPLAMALWAQQHGSRPPEEERSPRRGYPLAITARLGWVLPRWEPQAREGTCGKGDFALQPGEPITLSSVDTETYCALFPEPCTDMSLSCPR